METLVIISRAPYCDWTGRESLDMAFSLAAFDQPVTLLFTGEGVNWLRKAQQAAAEIGGEEPVSRAHFWRFRPDG